MLFRGFGPVSGQLLIGQALASFQSPSDSGEVTATASHKQPIALTATTNGGKAKGLELGLLPELTDKEEVRGSGAG
jgi:hypothetical protein